MSQKAKPKLAKGVKQPEAPREEEDLKVRISNSDEGELSDADLETATGGKAAAKRLLLRSCAKGKHIQEGTITL